MKNTKEYDGCEIGAVISSSLYCILSTALIVYACFLKSEPYSNSDNFRKCLEEFNCGDLNQCSRETVRHCSGMEPQNQYKGKIPDDWFTDESSKLYLSQISGEIMAKHNSRISEQGLSTHKSDLEKVKEVIRSAPNYVLHWYIKEWTTPDVAVWQTAKKFGKLGAIYTVSPGPANASNGSHIIATKDAIYHIYAKITFSCSKIDNETKRVSMKVLVTPPSGGQAKEILVASETARCYMYGDLVTLYQSGHFSLEAGSQIHLKYLTPNGVWISRGRHRAYKSFLGVYNAAQ